MLGVFSFKKKELDYIKKKTLACNMALTFFI